MSDETSHGHRQAIGAVAKQWGTGIPARLIVAESSIGDASGPAPRSTKPALLTMPVENEITGLIIDAAIEVHRIRPGLLESVYEEALAHELVARNLTVERQKMVPIRYKDAVLSTPLRLDLLVDELVEELVVVECKATTNYNPIYEAQALTYLRLLDLRLALVINFGERLVKDGLHRVVNHL